MENHLRVDRCELLKLKDCNSAILLADLEGFLQRPEPRRILLGGWFVYSILECKERTGLTYHKQSTTFKKLVAEGYIEAEVKGSPPLRHVRLKGV